MKISREKLLTEEALTFQHAVDISVSMQAVARESQYLKTSLKVHAASIDKCFCCGKTNHNEIDCYYREEQCYSCKKERPYCPFV